MDDISAEKIRRVTEEVLSRPGYELSPEPEEQASWWGTWFDGLATWLRGLADEVREALDSLTPWARAVAAAFALALLLAATVSLVRRARSRRKREKAEPSGAKVADAAEALEHRAHAAAEQGDYAEGVRLLLRAAVVRLEAAERRFNRPGTTNRELLRKYSSSAVFEPVRRLVETMDATWYGVRECTAGDYAECLGSLATVREQIARKLETTSQASAVPVPTSGG